MQSCCIRTTISKTNFNTKERVIQSSSNKRYKFIHSVSNYKTSMYLLRHILDFDSLTFVEISFIERDFIYTQLESLHQRRHSVVGLHQIRRIK